MEEQREFLGIQQYREAVSKVFGSKREIFRAFPNVFVTQDLDTLRNTPIEDVFYGKKPNYYNIPRAIALAHGKAYDFFEPLIVVSDQRLQTESSYRNCFMRENAVHALDSELIEISHSSTHGGYQAVRGFKDLWKKGLSRKERKSLRDWLGKISALTDIFRSNEMREAEEKYWREGQLLGKGFAKMAEK